MKEIKLKGLDQSVFYEKIDCGLDVYFIPIENKNSYTMQYLTKFGSRNNTFIPIGEKEMITVPDGIAHFLEHKMFEQEDGVDPFTFASKTGTNSNACTSYDCTRYYFSGNSGFNENLDYLLDFVNSPYFTDENVEKEQGIIAEEINLYDDEISWFMDEEIRKAFFNTDPYRIDIAGTIESISKIDKDILYRTYNTFYQPSNMIMIISGNFNMDDALNIIKKNESLKNKQTGYDIVEKEIVEEYPVHEKEKVLDFNIVNSKLSFGVKIPFKDVEDKFKYYLYLGLFNSIKFGYSSLFKEEIRKDDLTTFFRSYRENYTDYIFFGFDSETEKPELVLDMYKKELNSNNITEEDIERMKKVWISSEVYMTDNIDAMLDYVLDDIIMFGNVIDNRIEIIRSLNKDELVKIIDSIDFDNCCSLFVKPKK